MLQSIRETADHLVGGSRKNKRATSAQQSTTVCTTTVCRTTTVCTSTISEKKSLSQSILETEANPLVSLVGGSRMSKRATSAASRTTTVAAL